MSKQLPAPRLGPGKISVCHRRREAETCVEGDPLALVFTFSLVFFGAAIGYTIAKRHDPKK